MINEPQNPVMLANHKAKTIFVLAFNNTAIDLSNSCTAVISITAPSESLLHLSMYQKQQYRLVRRSVYIFRRLNK